MSTEVMDQSVLKKYGRDAAYSFKGLYKTSDWLSISHKIVTVVPLLFALTALGFYAELNSLLIRLFAIVSIATSIFALYRRKDYARIEGYRKLANDFKGFYNELRDHYHCGTDFDLRKLRRRSNELNERTTEYAISRIGRCWSRNKIKEEMDIEWTE